MKTKSIAFDQADILSNDTKTTNFFPIFWITFDSDSCPVY